MTEPVLYDVQSGVATITLNRPDVLNALSPAMLTPLRQHIEQAAADPAIRALILTGAGRGFCAGADLAARGPDDGRPRRVDELLRERYHPIIMGLRQMPKPVISAVNGVAAGAGMSLALAADIVLASDQASFLQAFARIGLIPDAGSTWLLDRYAGSMRARALAMLAEKIPAEQACEFGLVWRVYPADDLLAEATRLATQMATMPTLAYAGIKQALDSATTNDLAAQLEVEARLQQQASQTADHREGVAAFLAKRPAVFRGQ
ncbi:MAG: enoyl-CoA hydratase-related protein [Burkholderiaceae bacterium]